MTRTLQRQGDSQVLEIDKSIMEALGITLYTPLTLMISGNALIITPENAGLGRDKVRALLAEIRPEYNEMLENLSK